MITDSSTIAIPITAKARQQAQQFAQEQANPAKQRQVYRNTLAVCAVQTYLRSQLQLSAQGTVLFGCGGFVFTGDWAVGMSACGIGGKGL
jgi:hypothetical protein